MSLVVWIVFVAFFDNFAQLPVISPYSAALGADPVMVGAIVGAYSVSNLAGNVAAGLLLDRIGRRGPLLLGFLLAAAGLALYPLAATPGQLLSVRLLHGLGGGFLVPAAFTLIADARGQTSAGGAVMGRAGAVIGLAAIVAPPWAGWVAGRWGMPAVFWTVTGLFLVTAALAGRWVRITLVRPERRREAGWGALLSHPGLRAGYLTAFGLMVTLGILTHFFPTRVVALGYRQALAGAMFGVFSLVAVGLMVSPLSRLSDRAGRFRPVATGFVLVALALVMLPAASRPGALAGLMALYGAGFGLIFPAANALVADVATADRRGRGLGLFYAFWSLGAIAGPLAGGALAASALPLHPFDLAGLVAAAAAAGVLWLERVTGGKLPAG